MKKLLIIFLLLQLLSTSIVLGQSKRELRKQQKAEEVRKHYAELAQKRAELAQREAELDQRRTKLANNAKQRLESGEIEPLRPYEPGGELCKCTFQFTPSKDKVVGWTNPIGGKKYICVNHGLGDAILIWRKWYCLGEEDNCVRSEWKNEEPTFGKYDGGTMSVNLGGGTYFNIEGIEVNSAAYANKSYKERLSEYINVAANHKNIKRAQEFLESCEIINSIDDNGLASESNNENIDISWARNSNIKQKMDVVKEVFENNGLPINVTDSPDVFIIAGDEKSELYKATLLGKYIMIEKQKVRYYSVKDSTETILVSDSVDNLIIKDISNRLDKEVFDYGADRKFILISEDYQIHLIPVEETELANIGYSLFQLNEYKATIDYLEQAKRVSPSEGWWRYYQAQLAGAYWFSGNKELSKQNLDQMLIECQKDGGVLSDALGRKLLLASLQDIIKSIPEDEREYWNKIVFKIESL